MTRGRRTEHEAGVKVSFTARERALLLEHTFASPEYADRLVESGGWWAGTFMASDLDDLLDHLAAAANHAPRARLRQELDALIDRLEPLMEAARPGDRDARPRTAAAAPLRPAPEADPSVIRGGKPGPMLAKSRSRRVDVARAIARELVRAEHEHFVSAFIDNREHIPRVRRMSHAVTTGLAALGLSPGESAAVGDEVVAYAKELFLAEWLSDVGAGEDRERVLAEGIAEFHRILEAATGPVK